MYVTKNVYKNNQCLIKSVNKIIKKHKKSKFQIAYHRLMIEAVVFLIVNQTNKINLNDQQVFLLISTQNNQS